MSFHARRQRARKTFVPARRLSWSTETVRQLRELAEAGSSVTLIAASLGRSESAIRNKAAMHGISLRTTPDRGAV